MIKVTGDVDLVKLSQVKRVVPSWNFWQFSQKNTSSTVKEVKTVFFFIHDLEENKEESLMDGPFIRDHCSSILKIY